MVSLQNPNRQWCTRYQSENASREAEPRGILKSRGIRLILNKRRVEVRSQNRELLKKDVCTCLARRGVITRVGTQSQAQLFFFEALGTECMMVVDKVLVRVHPTEFGVAEVF